MQNYEENFAVSLRFTAALGKGAIVRFGTLGKYVEGSKAVAVMARLDVVLSN